MATLLSSPVRRQTLPIDLTVLAMIILPSAISFSTTAPRAKQRLFLRLLRMEKRTVRHLSHKSVLMVAILRFQALQVIWLAMTPMRSRMSSDTPSPPARLSVSRSMTKGLVPTGPAGRQAFPQMAKPLPSSLRLTTSAVLMSSAFLSSLNKIRSLPSLYGRLQTVGLSKLLVFPATA